MKLQIIVGSNRPGRVSGRIAKWVLDEAKNLPDTEAELVDLADYPLPFLDEPISPQFNPDRHPNPEAKKWLDKLAGADAYVLVTPEYNRSYPAVLKNALDYIDLQFAKKPVALVAHGSTGGAQSVASLRITLPGLLAAIVPQATFLLDRFGDKLNEDGSVKADVSQEALNFPQMMLKSTLESLKWYSDALAAARTAA